MIVYTLTNLQEMHEEWEQTDNDLTFLEYIAEREKHGEEQIDNILIRQKEVILKLANSSQEANWYTARQHLNLLQEMWEHCNYGYKLSELHTRLNQRYARKHNLKGIV